MDKLTIQQLLEKYKDGTISEEEYNILDDWYHSISYRNINFDKWVQESGGEALLINDLHEDFLAMYQPQIQKQPVMKNRLLKPVYLVTTIAAAIALLIFGLLFFSSPYFSSFVPQLDSASAVIKPGRNTARLTLADGKVIDLENTKNSVTGTYGNVSILKSKNGELSYEFLETKTGPGQKLTFNTISTPRGGQIRIKLPDGSRVWMNAESSLVIPSDFNVAKQRTITLTGEAYFEVEKQHGRPFLVLGNGQKVEVLGTHFNIHSYNDEKTIKTTLLEGSVRILGDHTQAVLVPGEQSVIQGENLNVSAVDAAQEVAWKDGMFVFDGQDFKSIMRTISRWYDVEIVYDYEPVGFSPAGQVSRFRKITDILRILEQTNDVKFKIEGRRIRVVK